MRRHRPAILALALAVLVVLPVAHGAAAVAPPSADGDSRLVDGAVPTGAAFVVEEQSNTTNYLGMDDDEVERSDFGTAGVDVGDAVAADVGQLEQGYAGLAFDAAYRNASGEERHDLLRAEADSVEDRIDALERDRSEATAAYNDEELTTRQFLARIATIDATAGALESRRALLEEAARESDISRAFLVRLANVESDLLGLQGPVREQIGAAVDATGPDRTVYVVTSADGMILTRTDELVYDREAYLGSERDPGGVDQFAQGSDPSTVIASDRATELYPWLYDQILPSTRQFGDTSVYYVSAETRGGTQFDAYLDGATRDVFREIQTKRVGSVPTYTIANRTDALRIRANHTHGTGPMRVAVTDPNTGQSVNASVTVNGHSIGWTGSDGRVTAVTPYDAVRIEATTADNESIRLPFFSR